MERLKERVAIAQQALATFQEALLADLTDRSKRDAAILRFAYTFEATQKCAQLLLAEQGGLQVVGPKTIARASFQSGFLEEGETERALRMVDDRNLVVHTYNERLAIELARRLHGHAAVLSSWIERMRARV